MKDKTMDSRLLDQYIREVHVQAGLYLTAVTFLNASVDQEGDTNLSVFFSIHGMLTHAGMISKLLWVADKRKRPESHGDEIRQVLRIEDRGWLLKSRSLRNNLEHYDERISTWHLEGGPIIDMNIGPKGMISMGPGIEVMFNRHYDPSTLEFEIRGITINLQALTDEVMQIRARSEAQLPEYNWRCA